MRIHTRIHKAVFGLLCILFLISGKYAVFAEDYPAWKDQTIQDESKKLPPDEVDQFNQNLSNLPFPTKVFIFDQIDKPIEEHIHALFDYYQLPDDQLLVLFVMETQEMAAMAGKELEQKGLTSDVLQGKMDTYFTPQALQGDYLSGIQFLLQEIYDEIAENNQEQEPIAAGSNDAESGSNIEEDGRSETEKKGNFSFLIWIGLLLILIAFFLFLQRNRLQKRLRELEAIKEELALRWQEVEFDFAAKTSQEEVLIRLANLEATYDDYRNRIFPELEEDFTDAYLLLKQFRIFAVKEFLSYIENTLENARYVLEQLNHEAHQLVEIKVELPKSIDKIYFELDKVKRKAEHVSVQFGISLSSLKEVIQAKEKELLKLELAAEEQSSIDLHHLDRIRQELQTIEQKLNQIDQMSQEMEERIPSRLKELEQKYKKASERGELKNGAELLSLLKEARGKWNSLITLWDEGRVDELAEVIANINERISHGEFLIQQQETQGREVKEHVEQYEQRIQEILEVFHYDLRAYDKLTRKYQLDDDPIVDLVALIEREKDEIEHIYKSVLKHYSQHDYGEAHQMAQSLMEKVSQFSENIAQFHQRVQSLSIQEEQSQQELKSLRNRLRLVRQQLDRSLLPGKQDHILEMIELGFRAILETEVLFDQIPLRLNKIMLQLDQAREQVADVERLTAKTIENAREAEEIIRRLNIYRNQIPQIGHLLMMAENCFRDQNFDEAVTIARKAESLIGQRKLG